MKTRSLLGFLPLLAAMIGGKDAPMGSKPPATLHSHGLFHRRGKFKGWMRENRKSTFNKNR
jgi:hypothetical protein